MNHSDQLDALAAAFAGFQGDVKNPIKDQQATIKMKAGGEFSYRFAALADVLDAVRPALSVHGLSVAQELVSDTNGGLGCATMLMHSSGQWVSFAPFFIPAGGDAKEYGGAASYARRYALMAALNLAAADDDVTTAAPRPPTRKADPADAAGEAMVTTRQTGKINAESKAAGLTEAQLKLQKTYGVATIAELTRDQASDLIARLIAYREEQTPAQAEPEQEDDIPF